GLRDLRDLAGRGLPVGLIATLAGQLDALLPSCPDPGMALTNLERFVAASPGPEATVEGLARRARTAEIVVQLFSTSPEFSELMIRDRALLGWLRGGAERRDRDALVAGLWPELEAAEGEEEPKLALRRARHREMLRTGYNDIVRGLPLEIITLDLSHLAD